MYFDAGTETSTVVGARSEPGGRTIEVALGSAVTEPPASGSIVPEAERDWSAEHLSAAVPSIAFRLVEVAPVGASHAMEVARSAVAMVVSRNGKGFVMSRFI
jgi:hypothetical protein